MFINLFENQTLERRPEDFDVKEWGKILDHLWKNRYSFGLENDTRYRFNRNSKQQLLGFSYEGLKAGKYAGVISSEKGVINIYPKLFRTKKNIILAEEKPDKFSGYVFSHILWWMSYSTKIRLPKTFSSYNLTGSDFLEVLIYLFAYYTENLLNNFSFNDYTIINEELTLVKGRIKYGEYIKNIGHGNWHKIPCEYDEFQHDNLLNQIILYVSKLLYPFTKEKRTKKLLDEILHHLSEVSDIYITADDCDKVKLNPLFEEYLIVLDYCRMFLSNSMVSSYRENIKVFSFLINTEKLFEDFIYGFIKQNKKELEIKRIEPQSGGYLGRQTVSGKEHFNISLDYLITKEDGETIIADAKYKRIYSKETSDVRTNNFGISNSDVFQMISYSNRKGIKKLHLIYPEYFLYKGEIIRHEFDLLNEKGESARCLKGTTINLINSDIEAFADNKSITELFKETEEKLRLQLKQLF